MQCDRRLFLQSLGIEESAACLKDNLRTVSVETVRSLASTPTDVHLWEILFCTIGDFPAPPEVQPLIEAAIMAIDIAPLSSSPDSCLTLLYEASLQTDTIRSPKAIGHVSSQVIEFVRLMCKRSQGDTIPEDQKRAFGVLLEVCAQLARSSGDHSDQGTEFVRIITEIVNVYPAVASLYRPIFQHLWPCTASQARLFWPLLIRSRAFDY